MRTLSTVYKNIKKGIFLTIFSRPLPSNLSFTLRVNRYSGRQARPLQCRQPVWKT